MAERGFGSDNAATIHPEVLAAITAANTGHAAGYGHDPLTERVCAEIGERFGVAGDHVFLVWNGTGANVTGLRAACRPWQAVICSDVAHINTDESGAPEWAAQVKLIDVPSADGKLTPDRVEPLIIRIGDEHAVQPRVLSLTESTELGTVYTLDELAALSQLAHDRGLLVQIDGARLANAAAALGCELGDLAAGADLVSFGGTKNGLLGGEAVILRNDALLDGFAWIRKQSMQLASKMRFLAAQFDALLADDLWQRSATHANAMAARLAAAISEIPGVTISRPVQANAVFAILPAPATAALHERFHFYDWDEAAGEVRWMCSWDTTEDDVDAFAAAVAATLGHG